MPATTDVIIAGAGYMVAPGTYSRTQDGLAEGPDRDGWPSTTSSAGSGGHFSLSGTAAGMPRAPAPPTPVRASSHGPLPPATPTPSSRTVTTIRAPHLVAGDYAYLAVGRFLYRSVALNAGSWGDFTQVADVGAGKTITRVVYYRGDLLLCCGAGLDVQRFAVPGGPLTTFERRADRQRRHRIRPPIGLRGPDARQRGDPQTHHRRHTGYPPSGCADRQHGSARGQSRHRHPEQHLAPRRRGRPRHQHLDPGPATLLHPRRLERRRRFPLPALLRGQAVHLARQSGRLLRAVGAAPGLAGGGIGGTHLPRGDRRREPARSSPAPSVPG